MNVLIYSVEDDKDIALIINKTLTHQGYEVKSFYDGESFFKEFELRKPNIILLDMMLPDMSGTDILKKIRSVDIYKDIQILIVSAKNMLWKFIGFHQLLVCICQNRCCHFYMTLYTQRQHLFDLFSIMSSGLDQ